MEKINSIVLIVHPFYTYNMAYKFLKMYAYIEEHLGEEAENYRKIWRGEIDSVKKNKKSILILVSNRVEEGRLEEIKGGARPKGYEEELVAYAHKNLGERLFTFYYTLEERDLSSIERIKADKAMVFVYGEWTSGCYFDEAENLSEGLKIPRKCFRFFPKKSRDTADGYPPEWELEKIKKLPREIRIPIIRERIRPYLDRLKKFMKGVNRLNQK